MEEIIRLQKQIEDQCNYISSIKSENEKLTEQKNHLQKSLEYSICQNEKLEAENAKIKQDIDNLKHGFEIYEKQMEVVKMIFTGKEGK